MYLRGFLNVAEGRKRRSQWRSEAVGGGHHQPPRALTSEGGHRPRNPSSLGEPEKQKKQLNRFSPRASRRNTTLQTS